MWKVFSTNPLPVLWLQPARTKSNTDNEDLYKLRRSKFWRGAMVCQVQQIVAVTIDLAQFSWTDLSANFRDGAGDFSPSLLVTISKAV
jgi:hypothetical protein